MVLVEGPPRIGLSTIARQLAAGMSSGALIADARRREGRAILASPESQSAARPILLDNAGPGDGAAIARWAHSVAADEGKRSRLPRFVLLGGPFEDSGPVVSAGPLSLFEAGRASVKRLWFRGGYPEAYGAASDEAAMDWLESYAADLAHGALIKWHVPLEPEILLGLLEGVAVANGETFNENAAARALGISRPTVSRYINCLTRAGILFAVPSFQGIAPDLQRIDPAPRGSFPVRSVKSAALYVRDSGLLHALTGAKSADELALKPRAAAASWAGFVLGQVRDALPEDASLCRFASADGAALDLVVVKDGIPVAVASARWHRSSSVERSILYAARAVSGSPRLGRFIVAPDGDDRSLPGGFIVTNLGAFLEKLDATTA